MHFSDGRTGCTDNCSMLQTVDKSPNLLSHDACYTLGVLKPCYTVEKALPVSGTSTDSTNPTKCQVTPSKVGNSFLHHEMKGTVKKLSDNSTKHSNCKRATSRWSIHKAGHP